MFVMFVCECDCDCECQVLVGAFVCAVACAYEYATWTRLSLIMLLLEGCARCRIAALAEEGRLGDTRRGEPVTGCIRSLF